MSLEKGLMLDLAKTLPAGFTMDDLIAAGSKPGDDPLAKLHNHGVKEAAWGLVDDGLLAPDGKGGLVIQEAK